LKVKIQSGSVTKDIIVLLLFSSVDSLLFYVLRQGVTNQQENNFGKHSHLAMTRCH